MSNHIDRELSLHIDKLAEQDQNCRKKLVELKNDLESNAKDIENQVEIIRKIDASNLIEAKKILQENGYPGIDLVGKRSSHNYWILIQHCDSDPKFQDEALKAMRVELENGNVDPIDYAYLSDRTLVNHNKPQIYGTQMLWNEDLREFTPKEMIEPTKINERRKSIGLESIENYKMMMKSLYFRNEK